jgi:hypothetical protein
MHQPKRGCYCYPKIPKRTFLSPSGDEGEGGALRVRPPRLDPLLLKRRGNVMEALVEENCTWLVHYPVPGQPVFADIS